MERGGGSLRSPILAPAENPAMTDQTSISGHVAVEPTSREFVAFKLLEKIAHHEQVASGEKAKREYWLTLYRQCYKLTTGDSLKYVLDTKDD